MQKLLHLVTLLLVLLTLQVGPGVCAASCASMPSASPTAALAPHHAMQAASCCHGMNTRGAATLHQPGAPCPSTNCVHSITAAPFPLFPSAPQAAPMAAAPTIVLPRSVLDQLPPPARLLPAGLTQAARRWPLRV